jgi:hypothetical protein
MQGGIERLPTRACSRRGCRRDEIANGAQPFRSLPERLKKEDRLSDITIKNERSRAIITRPAWASNGRAAFASEP